MSNRKISPTKPQNRTINNHATRFCPFSTTLTQHRMLQAGQTNENLLVELNVFFREVENHRSLASIMDLYWNWHCWWWTTLKSELIWNWTHSGSSFTPKMSLQNKVKLQQKAGSTLAQRKVNGNLHTLLNQSGIKIGSHNQINNKHPV